ncbi:MAG: cell division protein FtsK, partial [Alphaproteobacteria bacterium]|nr:cell division protein FtsK [Alphaproteobacteria bacterium]
MRSHASGHFTEQLREFAGRRLAELLGVFLVATAAALTLALISWSARDPSFNHATAGHVRNLLGPPGAIVSDLLMQLVGFGAIAAIVPIATQGLRLMRRRRIGRALLRVGLWTLGVFATAATASLLPATDRWPLPTGLGGVAGDAILAVPRTIFAGSGVMLALFGAGAALVAILAVTGAAGFGFESEADMRSRSSEDDANIRPAAEDDDDDGGEPGVALISLGALIHLGLALKAWIARTAGRFRRGPRTTDRPPPPRYPRVEPIFEEMDLYPAHAPQRPRNLDEADAVPPPAPRRTRNPTRAPQPSFNARYETPPLNLLAEPKKQASGAKLSQEA